VGLQQGGGLVAVQGYFEDIPAAAARDSAVVEAAAGAVDVVGVMDVAEDGGAAPGGEARILFPAAIESTLP